MASGMLNGRNGHRNEYPDANSIVGYIPDDVSSIHSSALGGMGVPAGYPPMFQSFTPDTWPTPQNGPIRKQNGAKARGAAESITGDSTMATESDIAGSVIGQGGVSLDTLAIQDPNRQTSYNQSDRLKRYVEGASRPGDSGSVFGGSSLGARVGNLAGPTEDEDARSVSTAFASQVGGAYD